MILLFLPLIFLALILLIVLKFRHFLIGQPRERIVRGNHDSGSEIDNDDEQIDNDNDIDNDQINTDTTPLKNRKIGKKKTESIKRKEERKQYNEVNFLIAMILSMSNSF
jgi:hypothetical protein